MLIIMMNLSLTTTFLPFFVSFGTIFAFFFRMKKKTTSEVEREEEKTKTLFATYISIWAAMGGCIATSEKIMRLVENSFQANTALSYSVIFLFLLSLLFLFIKIKKETTSL